MSTDTPDGRVRDLPGAVEYSKTVGEADVYMFAGVSGDFSPVHVNAQYAAGQPIGERIAHGALLVALMSAAATQWAAKEGLDILSYGYDKIRFITPVRFGDTITVAYAHDRSDSDGHKMYSRIDAYNQSDQIVGVATHILWLMTPTTDSTPTPQPAQAS